MKTLIFGAGPIGQWLALRLRLAGKDVTLLARNETYRSLEKNGIEIFDGLTQERQHARVELLDHLAAEDRFDLVVVAAQKASRLAICQILARNTHLKHILFLGNDVSGFCRYRNFLPERKLLIGFPGVGGGWDGSDLVIMDREKPNSLHGEIFFGELDGTSRKRTKQIKKLFMEAGIGARIEKSMDGWLKYHFAFIAPTAGAFFKKGGEMGALAADREAIHQYCRACREAGNVLSAAGYRKRQPPIFNLYYWLPRWLEPKVFGKFFGSRSAKIRFGLHAQRVVLELLEMADEFAELTGWTDVETPNLDELLSYVAEQYALEGQMEMAS